KRIDNDAPFEIDDRKPRDLDARGHLFLWFCAMHVHVVDGDTIALRFWGGVPASGGVARLIAGRGGITSTGGLEVTIPAADTAFLRDLADEIEAIIARRYSVPSYKFVCPRTAASLRRLAGVLDAHAASRGTP